jgi:hypothetical protein
MDLVINAFFSFLDHPDAGIVEKTVSARIVAVNLIPASMVPAYCISKSCLS